MKVYGLIGYPLTHSFSKSYFTSFFEREKNRDCRYENFPLQSLTQIKQLLELHRNLVGLNITIPYKKAVLYYLDEASEEVKRTGACNCIKIKDGKFYGFNTDVKGFENSLRKYLQPHHDRALVLGTGGAASAVTYVLQKLNIPATSVSREPGPGKTTYARLNKKVVDDHKLIINTSPLGMHPDIDNYPNIPYEHLTSSHFLFDLIYNPEKTEFLKKGEAKGSLILNGHEMLVIQAEESWRIWNDESL